MKLAGWRAGDTTEQEPRRPTVPGARLLGTAWLPLLFVTNHRFFFGEGHAGNAVNALMEVGAYAFAVFILILLFAGSRARGEGHRSLLFIGLFILPVWAMASQIWGEIGGTPFARSAEFGVIALLTNVAVNRARETPGFLEDMLWFIVRWFAYATILLMLFGFAAGPLWARVSPGETRYTWVAAHPAVSGFFLSALIPVLLAAPKSVLRFPFVVRVMLLGLATIALIKNHSRTSVVAGVLAAAAAIWLLGRLKTAIRIVVPTYAIGLGAVAALYASKAVGSYALRGGPTAQLLNLNNRTKVWAELPEKLGTPGRWLIGLGIGSTKTAFIGDFDWAGNAHNSVVALVLSMGIVGLVIVLCYLVYGIVGVWRTLLRSDPLLGIIMLTIMLTLIVTAVTGDVFAQPNFGVVWMYLCMAVPLAAGGPHDELATASAAEPGRYSA